MRISLGQGARLKVGDQWYDEGTLEYTEIVEMSFRRCDLRPLYERQEVSFDVPFAVDEKVLKELTELVLDDGRGHHIVYSGLHYSRVYWSPHYSSGGHYTADNPTVVHEMISQIKTRSYRVRLTDDNNFELLEWGEYVEVH